MIYIYALALVKSFYTK